MSKEIFVFDDQLLGRSWIKNFLSDVNERRSPCELTDREWSQRVVDRVERLRVLQNRRDSMSNVKWKSVPLHRVGSEREQDHWSWALDLLVVDKVVHWSVDERPLSDLSGSGANA